MLLTDCQQFVDCWLPVLLTDSQYLMQVVLHFYKENVAVREFELDQDVVVPRVN